MRCEEASRANSATYRGLNNVGLFVALLEQDISAFSECIYFARSEWHRQFHARNLAVLLFEGAEDLSELLGKEYRLWLKEIAAESLVDSLNQIHSKLSSFQRKHGQFLKEVRTYVGAHRDHDSLAQLDLMSRFNAIDVYKLGAEFSVPLRELLDFYMVLLTHMNKPDVMLRAAARASSSQA